MWRSLIQPILCAGLYAPSPPNPALLGRAGCRLPTWTRGSRYLAGKLREEGLQVTSPEDSGIVVPIWSLGVPSLRRGGARAQPASDRRLFLTSCLLSGGPLRPPSFPGRPCLRMSTE